MNELQAPDEPAFVNDVPGSSSDEVESAGTSAGKRSASRMVDGHLLS
ncbi:hypothetical protein PWY87_35050 [Kribbella solani]|nr:hypothetical protein [Kribbella solani]